jgi:hypothetical protein
MKQLNFLFLSLAISAFLMLCFSPCDALSNHEKSSSILNYNQQEAARTVEVSFRIKDDGKVEIINIESNDPVLIDYVVSKLKKIQLKNGQGSKGEVIRYRFVFKEQA